MAGPTAKTLQQVHDYFAGFPDLDAEFVKTEALSWRFRVTNGTNSTEILIPFSFTDSQQRQIARQLQLYFALFGGK